MANTERSAAAFYRDCCRRAWIGSCGLANAFAAILGGFLLAFLAWMIGPDMPAPSSFAGTLAFAFLATVASAVLAWCMIFVARFVLAPARLYAETIDRLTIVETEIARLTAISPLEIFYDPNDKEGRFVYDGLATKVFGPRLSQYEKPNAITYAFGVRNNKNDKTIRDVHIGMEGDDGILRHLPLSRGFQERDLHPGSTDLFFLLSLQRNSREEGATHDPNNTLNKVGNFTIRVRATDTKEVAAKFRYDPDATPQITMLASDSV